MHSARNKDAKGSAQLNGKEHSVTSDAELVSLTRQGNKRAFVAIVARYQAMVCGIALGVLGDFGESEDAAQEAFLLAWRKIDDLREPHKLRPWLAQISRNAALGYLRKKKAVAHEDLGSLVDESPGPDESMAKHEEAALVRSAVAKLPEAYRFPLILYYREGQSVEAVALALSISEDAVKQRLARGRAMLRKELSGIVENVLIKTGPTPIFTVLVAAAIGGLATPSSVAAAAFAAGAGQGAFVGKKAAGISFFMTTSKTLVISSIAGAIVCTPIGYFLGGDQAPPIHSSEKHQSQSVNGSAPRIEPPSFESSEMFAHWKSLRENYGSTAEAMPALYEAVKQLKDPLRRDGFELAVIAEWAQLDPVGGLAYSNNYIRRPVFEQWLAREPSAAVQGLMSSGKGWDLVARSMLPEIAKRSPSSLAGIVSALPKDENIWHKEVRDAFAIAADADLTGAKKSAETITGPNRDQALSGVARSWAAFDLNAAIAWAKALPEGANRDEIIREALVGRAATDPVGALDQVGIVPAGGRRGYSATTTAARVLKEAAKNDFESTMIWLAGHPGRFSYEDLAGLDDAITQRLNSNASGFLTTAAETDALSTLLPSIHSALINDAGGQIEATWEWLKTQPDSETTKRLKENVLASASRSDPREAFRLIQDLTDSAERNSLLKIVAQRMINGGINFSNLEKFLPEAPDQLRGHLLESAFNGLSKEWLGDPQSWAGRLSSLPPEARQYGAKSLGRAWAETSLDEAMSWMSSLTTGEDRFGAISGIADTWARKDPQGALAWISSMPPGLERDKGTRSVIEVIAEQYPQESWQWALSINDARERIGPAEAAIRNIAKRDPTSAVQKLAAATFSQQDQTRLRNALLSMGIQLPKM